MRLKLFLTRRAHYQADVAQRFFVFMRKTPSYIISSNPQSNFYFLFFSIFFPALTHDVASFGHGLAPVRSSRGGRSEINQGLASAS
jgi:hypothetical protein